MLQAEKKFISPEEYFIMEESSEYIKANIIVEMPPYPCGSGKKCCLNK
ncbi:MAG: hypothetical protein GY749_40965 [Desulfobacteraceae bacterium]|nr:hypothetical protein [Desulfobacteraceae bacterium]